MDDNPRRSKGQKSKPTSSTRDPKRQKKDEKFGYGGKKRYSKSGDAFSSADTRTHPGRRAKEEFNSSKKKTGTKRLGKSRRVKTGT